MSEIVKDDVASEIEKALGGDPRVMALLEIAMTAYKFLPVKLFDMKLGRPSREKIEEAIRAFGIPCARMPWERFPNRFHDNLPELQMFTPGTPPEAIDQYFDEIIAAQPARTPSKKRKKAS